MIFGTSNQKNFFGFPKIKCLNVTGEADSHKSVRCSCQICQMAIASSPCISWYLQLTNRKILLEETVTAMLMASKNRTHYANFLISALMLLVGWQERHPACKKN